MKVCSRNIKRKQMRNELLNREKPFKGPWKEYDETTLWFYSYREVLHIQSSSSVEAVGTVTWSELWC